MYAYSHVNVNEYIYIYIYIYIYFYIQRVCVWCRFICVYMYQRFFEGFAKIASQNLCIYIYTYVYIYAYKYLCSSIYLLRILTHYHRYSHMRTRTSDRRRRHPLMYSPTDRGHNLDDPLQRRRHNTLFHYLPRGADSLPSKYSSLCFVVSTRV